MGIGNPRSADKAPVGTHHSSSLPLMGIGNVRASVECEASVACVVLAHYPSWGSGTRMIQSIDLDMAFVYLITPHGDREPDRHQGDGHGRDVRPSHYPSWGSGTVRPVQIVIVVEQLDISLPLMGIGNQCTRRRAFRLPVLVLITPHGDREPWSNSTSSRPWHAHSLITPHGDRERQRSHHRTHSGCHRQLITPHGDREQRHRIPRGARLSAHYPSWGSGTRRSRRRSAAVAAHYPSWGSGTRSA